MGRVTLIDYGIGNLLSVERAFKHIGAECVIARTVEEIQFADRLVLPGVGAFKSCVDELDRRNLADAVREFVPSGKPLLGICVGMQMLFEASEEFGEHKGFGFLSGKVKAIPATGVDGQPHKIPHIGWTSLILPPSRESWNETLLNETPLNAEVYFVHSFTAHPGNVQDRLADAEYNGCSISAMVNRDNIYGAQFHPEKSGPVGLKILENFSKL